MSNLEKESGYFENPRSEIQGLLKAKYKKSLDVGCGAGIVSAALKSEGRIEVAHGVELHPAAASEAKKRLDEVFSVDLCASDIPSNQYDLVLCLDVLEHMNDPWVALKRIRSKMAPEGTLITSIPNVRNFRVLLPLLLFGKWTYTEAGILDSTHIRFFTKSSAQEMVENAGFEIVSITSTGKKFLSITWWLNLLTLGLARGLFELQYLIVATPNKN